MTQILCARLKSWPIDRLRRRRPELRHEPIALVQTIGLRQLVAAASDEAKSQGVWSGMMLAQAHAVCPGLLHFPFEPDDDRRALVSLSRWMIRYSPAVSPQPPDAIFLNVTGCQRLYGGLDVLLQKIQHALAKFQIGAQLAIAPTTGAAWAISCNPDGQNRIIAPHDLQEALNKLPPSTLRIDPAIAAMLDNLGIHTIAQLLALPRDELPSRFGTLLLTRLDEALGQAPEPLDILPHVSPIHRSIEFDGPVENLEVIWLALQKLTERIAADLLRHGCGARRLDVEFHRMYAPPVCRSIRLLRPGRDAKNLFKLLQRRCEKLADDGFIAIHLRIPSYQRLDDPQLFLTEHEEQIAEQEVTHLIEMLCARFGQYCILQPRLYPSHLPERAYTLLPCLTSCSTGILPVPSQILKKAASSRKKHSSEDTINPPPVPLRPLRLFKRPIEISAMAAPSHDGDGPPIAFTFNNHVHRLPHAAGPHRISGLWWQAHHKTRDYFDVEDESGQRFWLFRVLQNGKWFMQGTYS